MVSLELLSSLDGLIWLQSGKKVGELFHQHQTTVSRNLKKCSQAFGVRFLKQGGAWLVDGDRQLLKLEREVHQCARFQGKAPLRLEANGWNSSVLSSPPPAGWVTGTSQVFGVEHALQLVLDHIVDAWLCPLPDAPTSHAELSVIPLCEVPMQLLVAPDHPLLQQAGLTLEEIKHYPLHWMPATSYPGTKAMVEKLGLWPRANSKPRAETDLPSLQASERIVHLSCALTQSRAKPTLVPLGLNLDAHTGVALIIRRDYSNNSCISALCSDLRKRLRHLQQSHPDIQLLS